MEEVERTDVAGEVTRIVDSFDEDFTGAMNQDFDTPLALMILTGVVGRLKQFAETHEQIGTDEKKVAIEKVILLARTLGLLEKDSYKEKLQHEVLALIKERSELRKEKKFKEADDIRKRLLLDHKIILEDTEYGMVWYKKT